MWQVVDPIAEEGLVKFPVKDIIQKLFEEGK